MCVCCCRMMEVEVGHHNVLLTRCEGRFSAIGNQCTHYGAPLSKGTSATCHMDFFSVYLHLEQLSPDCCSTVYLFGCVSVSRSPHRPHSALPVARRLFQRPNRGSRGISWYRQFTVPQGKHRQQGETDTQETGFAIILILSVNLFKVKIQNSKVYVSVNKRVSGTCLLHLCFSYIVFFHICLSYFCLLWKREYQCSFVLFIKSS